MRSFCFGTDGKVANRDYKIVAATLGWEQNSKSARVNPNASLSSLPFETVDLNEDRPFSSQHVDHVNTVSGADTLDEVALVAKLLFC